MQRIDVDTARDLVASGEALLVCAYADDRTCDRHDLEPAIHFSDFQQRRRHLDKSTTVILYCG